MSINQFFQDIPETIWWPQQYQHQVKPFMEPHPNHPNSSSWPSFYYQPTMFPPQNTLNFNLNTPDDEDEHDPEETNHPQYSQEPDKEPMFEKPLTPSDVGKLNRLVIPKQHAEKYFPLGGGGGGGDSGEKGLLLSFEDESGKCWRFRYSYWNSSQSYVLTKGWSRYVKEKQLDAGDVVLFERHRTDMDRLFIGWRRRGDNRNNSSGGGVMVHASTGGGGWSTRGLMYPSSSTTTSSTSGVHHPYPLTQHGGHGGGANVAAATATVPPCVPYQPDCLLAGSGAQNQAMAPLGNSKRFRLFGVNFECFLDDSEPSTPDDGSSLSSQGASGPAPAAATHHQFYATHTPMDITFSSQDVNQMRNRRG